MKRSTLMAGTLAMVTVAALACSNETAGEATPGTTSAGGQPSTSGRIPFPSVSGIPTTEPTTSSGGGTGGSPLADTDPCTLSAKAGQQAGLGSGSMLELTGIKHCRYTTADSALDVSIYPEAGLADYQGSSKQVSVGSHQGLQASGSVGVCTVAIGVSDKSRVDVSATKTDGSDSCGLATQVATALEPSLPG